MIAATTTGFATGFSLILAIGAQNAFVLRQGLAREHVFWLCLLCAVSDAIFIAVGVWGFASIIDLYPTLPKFMAYAGAVFLLAYGAIRFAAAIKGDYKLELEGNPTALLPTLLTAVALTWLNPHVYLDTVGLIGAISTKFDGSHRLAFGIGAITASFVFFFSLGYGARYMAPIMQSVRAWRILDIVIGIVMWTIAYSLVY